MFSLIKKSEYYYISMTFNTNKNVTCLLVIILSNTYLFKILIVKFNINFLFMLSLHVC